MQADFRLLDVVGKRSNAIHRLIDVLKGFHAVGAGDQFDLNRAGAFPRRGGDFFDPLHAADGFFHRQQNPLFDLGRRRTRIHHAHLDDVELKLRKDFFLDVVGRPDAAADQDDHQQIGGDGVARHPGDGAGATIFVGGRF